MAGRDQSPTSQVVPFLLYSIYVVSRLVKVQILKFFNLPPCVTVCLVLVISLVVTEYKPELNPRLFSNGFSALLLDRFKDVADFEWTFWTQCLWQLLPLYSGYVMLSQMVRWKLPQFQASFYLLFSMLAIWYVVGIKALLLVLIQCAVIYISSLTHSVMAVWATSIAILSSLNFDYTLNVLIPRDTNDPMETNFYLQVFSLSMSNLRYTGFCLDKVWHERNLPKAKTYYFKRRKSNNDVNAVESKTDGTTKEHLSTMNRNADNIETPAHDPAMDSTPASASNEAITDETSARPSVSDSSNVSAFYSMLTGSNDQQHIDYGFLHMLTYVLYFPLYFTGPVLIYPEFYKQLTASTPSTALSKFIALFRMVFWWTFNDLVLYYFYFHAMYFNYDVLNKMSLWTLAMSGYCHGMFFMTKYVVMFGFPGVIASYDNIITPKTPKCLSTLVMFSDIWKYFDRGLYSFLSRYIYIPVGGSQCGWKRQLFGSFLTFLFIFYWHGAMWYLFVWSALNFVGICIEVASKRISRWPAVVNFEVHYLTPAWRERLYGLLTVPLYALSIIAIFIFFGDTKVGMIYFNRFLINADAVSLPLTILTLYCCIQSSTYITSWQASVKQKTS